VPKTSIPPDDWVELIPESLEDDYTIQIEDAPVYLSPGDEPARPVEGIEVAQDSKQSGQLDRGTALWARAVHTTPATARVVPSLQLKSTERNVEVFNSVETNTAQRQNRQSLPVNQRRVTFILTATSASSTYNHVENPISPGQERSLFVLEESTQMPFQPDAGRNLEIIKLRNSVDVPAVIRIKVNGQEVSKGFIESGAFRDKQQAGGLELLELVNNLDGTHSIDITVENLDSTADLEGSIFIRTIEEDLVND
jgi:hypothetical protein